MCGVGRTVADVGATVAELGPRSQMPNGAVENSFGNESGWYRIKKTEKERAWPIPSTGGALRWECREQGVSEEAAGG